ncbi:hypothetical protein CR513_47223, partial [Mucuna pruriens]
MCPTLQEIESDHPKSVGVIGGYQYGKQSYQSRQFDNQYGKQPFRPGPSQGPYAAQRFRSAPNVPQSQSGTTFPTTTTTTENATSRQLTISKGPDETVSNKQPKVSTKYELQQYAVSAKHERHHPRHQDANRTASKHCEPFTVGRVWYSTLTNNSEFEGECERSNSKKWRITTNNTATRAEAD